MLIKNLRFQNYIVKYNSKKVNKEINKLISSPQLKKQVANPSLESFEIFSYIIISKEY